MPTDYSSRMKVGGIRCTELLLLCIVVPVHINAQDVVSASVNIYCFKHYTGHVGSNRNEHFVQHAGTFGELFMLVRVLLGIMLIDIYFHCAAISPYCCESVVV